MQFEQEAWFRHTTEPVETEYVTFQLKKGLGWSTANPIRMSSPSTSTINPLTYSLTASNHQPSQHQAQPNNINFISLTTTNLQPPTCISPPQSPSSSPPLHPQPCSRHQLDRLLHQTVLTALLPTVHMALRQAVPTEDRHLPGSLP